MVSRVPLPPLKQEQHKACQSQPCQSPASCALNGCVRRLPAASGFNASGSKYLRTITTVLDNKVDVYAVLEAFNVTCPARQHAIKKLLCAGLRSKGNAFQDLKEAGDAVARAVQMEQAREDREGL